MTTANVRNLSPSEGGIRRHMRGRRAYVALWLLCTRCAVLLIWMDPLGTRVSCESGYAWD